METTTVNDDDDSDADEDTDEVMDRMTEQYPS